MINLSLFISVIGILTTIILFLIGYIIYTWKTESVLSAENKSFARERAKTDKEISKLRENIVSIKHKMNREIDKLKEDKINLENKFNSNFSQKTIRDKYTSHEYGFSVSKETGHYFCTSCLLSSDTRESPLTKHNMGWSCEYKDCDKFYSDPNWRPPQNIGGGPNSWMGT